MLAGNTDKLIDELLATHRVQAEPSSLSGIESGLVERLLPPYDDVAVPHLRACRLNWEARERLINCIRGANYVGDLQRVTLVIDENPVESLAMSGMRRYLHLTTRENIQNDLFGL